MIFFILHKYIKNYCYFIIGSIIYLFLFNISFIHYYSVLIIPLDLYFVYTTNSREIEFNDSNIDITEYKELIKAVYYKYKNDDINDDINNSILFENKNENENKNNKYRNLYKPTNLKLEHTIKHTLHNINT